MKVLVNDDAMQALGVGNIKKLKMPPKVCRASDRANAFLGGFRLGNNKAK